MAENDKKMTGEAQRIYRRRCFQCARTLAKFVQVVPQVIPRAPHPGAVLFLSLAIAGFSTGL